MSRDDTTTASSELTARLHERTGLTEVQLPNGQVVYKGDFATQALSALGPTVKAFTLPDGRMLVHEHFDMTNPADVALAAHEGLHSQYRKAGIDPGMHAEELAADAAGDAARMIFDAGSTSTGDLLNMGVGSGDGQQTPGLGGAPGGTAGPGPTLGGDAESKGPSPDRGYQALIDQGLTRADIVDLLTRQVIDSMDKEREDQKARHPSKSWA